MRRVIAALIVVGLTIAVILLWPSPTAEIPPDTLAGPTTTTTTTSPPTTIIVPDTTTTSTAEGSQVVETVEEAEEILRELWFGWFEGIYHQDEDRIREVVGNPEQIQNAVDQFGVMEFEHMPTLSGISLDETEILRSDSECLALWSEVEATFRDGSLAGVHVFRPHSSDWLLINTWPLRDDLWEADCDVQLQ
jgi:predicted RNase H-like HicB family nuclease